MLNVEQAIREVGGVFQAVMGRPIQPGTSELPPEVDPIGHVERRYHQLKTLLDTRGVTRRPEWSPLVDVIELEREVRFEIEIPGVPRDAILITISGDYLVVRGERAGHRPEGAVVRHQERALGAFQKAIALPPRARRDSIQATLKDGILVVTVPTDGTTGDGTEVPIAIK